MFKLKIINNQHCIVRDTDEPVILYSTAQAGDWHELTLMFPDGRVFYKGFGFRISCVLDYMNSSPYIPAKTQRTLSDVANSAFDCIRD